jgi:hypothetical protein
MIFGAMRDKAVGEVGRILFPFADELVFTAPGASVAARAMPPQDLQNLAHRGHAEPTIQAAVEHTLQRASADDVIIVTGSLYLVGEARALFLAPTGGRWSDRVKISLELVGYPHGRAFHVCTACEQPLVVIRPQSPPVARARA